MPPATWTAWKIDAQGNRIEKTGDGSMPADPFDASVPGTTTTNGTPQPANSNPAATPVANSTPADASAGAPATPPPPPPPPPPAPPAVTPTPPPAATPEPAAATPPPAAPPTPAAAPSTPATPPSPPANSPSPPPTTATTSPKGTTNVDGASVSDFATPVSGSSGSSLSNGAIAAIATFLVIFVVGAILGIVYLRRRRRRQRETSVQAAFNLRRASTSDRAQRAGFAATNLIKNSPKNLPKRSMQGHLSLSKIGAPVLVKATTDQEVMASAIPAGSSASKDDLNSSLMVQLGFESVPISPRHGEFGNIPLGDKVESRVSSEHMRVRPGHGRDRSFDFSRVDPTASMGGVSSNYLIASPKTAMPRDRPDWGDNGPTASSPFYNGKSAFGPRRF